METNQNFKTSDKLNPAVVRLGPAQPQLVQLILVGGGGVVCKNILTYSEPGVKLEPSGQTQLVGFSPAPPTWVVFRVDQLLLQTV